MWSIGQFASKVGISRTSILYYEKLGLLEPAMRGDNGYRWYSQSQADRLQTIISYRSFGVPVSKLEALLDSDQAAQQQQLLQQQFHQLQQQIDAMRQQQAAILKLLDQPQMHQSQIDKQRWSEIMQAAGMSEQDMHNWHKQFEKLEPQGHQQFLESLNIDSAEIKKIRSWSK